MKKVVLSLALVATMAFVSCKETKTEETVVEETPVEVAPVEAAPVAADTTAAADTTVKVAIIAKLKNTFFILLNYKRLIINSRQRYKFFNILKYLK